jgi:hypothetical protein
MANSCGVAFSMSKSSGGGGVAKTPLIFNGILVSVDRGKLLVVDIVGFWRRLAVAIN